jgi:CubicO group peptidase (beta-lactamase class C family)
MDAVGPFAQWQASALRSLSRARLVFRPGRRFRYSNLGTVALGLALERATGRPYVELVKDRVLEPLGMRQTTFFVPPQLRHAPHLALSKSGAAEHDGRGGRVPSGGLYSTVEDLGRFAAALYGEGPPGFLSERSRRLQATPALRDSRYGLGIRAGRLAGRRTLQHAGAIHGYRAALLIAPDARLGVVVLQAAGSGRPPPMTLAHRLLGRLLYRFAAETESVRYEERENRHAHDSDPAGNPAGRDGSRVWRRQGALCCR